MRRPAFTTSTALVLLVLALALPFTTLMANNMSLYANVMIAAIGALGLEILTGRTGQVSLGHAFFLGIGAYTAGYIGGNHGITAALWLPAAAIVAGVVGGLVGPTALRLRGLYLAIVTIGLVFIGQHIFTNWSALTGGPGGRAIPDVKLGSLDFGKGETIAGLAFTRDRLYYYLALIILVLGMLYVRNLDRSRAGRGMSAVREREVAAAVLGVNVASTKVMAFVISSMFAGVSGALYGAHLSFVEPNSWGLALSVNYVVMIVVGGMASLYGPVVGALFVIGLPTLLQNHASSLPFISSGDISPADAAQIAFGVLLIVFLLVEPRGVVGLGARIVALFRRVSPQRTS
jgi:branched-chain amino acid transport system permease protein